ncbi:hypothetical protein [Bacillus ndiopicus]|uniref:hypothetical protein n=1 Tax=Bacillus ndiopicus TaxID=1347368 RepID=UPI000A629BDE|nr:hypothetical protein [Bacillus ndiopicus]
MKNLKKIIVGVISLVFLFSIVAQVPAAAAQVEIQKNEILSTIFTEVLELDSKFDNTIYLEGDYIALDTNLAIKQGATKTDINLAKSKIDGHNQITEDISTLQPYVVFDENGLNFDEESARKANVSEDLIVTTVKDFELMNSVGILADCKGKSNFEKTADGFYTYFDSCETATIITYIQIGAAIASLGLAIAAFIAPPVGLATIIAVGLYDIGAIALNLVNIQGCGTWIKWKGTNNPNPFWVGSQC